MSQFERGGMNAQRWPAELSETDDPEGTVGEEMRDRFSEGGGDAQESSERLSGLPAHEDDAARGATGDVGAGVMSAGGTASETGEGTEGSQPVPEEEAASGVADDDSGGLPPYLERPGHI